METTRHWHEYSPSGNLGAVLALAGIFFLVSYPMIQAYVMRRLRRRAALRRRLARSASPTMRTRTR